MEAPTALYRYWKFIGMLPFNLTNDGVVRFSYGGTIYSIVLAVAYIMTFINVVGFQMSVSDMGLAPIAMIASWSGFCIECTSVVILWVYFGVRLNQVQRIIDRLKNINKKFADHGIHADGKRFVREVKIHTVIVNFIWYLLCLIYFTISMRFQIYVMLHWLPLIVSRVVSYNVVLMFVDVMRLIKDRFRLVNEKILNLSDKNLTRILPQRDMTKIRVNNFSIESFAAMNPLQAYGQIHSDLVDFLTIVVEFFSFSILILMMYQYIQVSISIYGLCLSSLAPSFQPLILIWAFWTTMHFLVIIVLIVVCDSAADEANQTGNILHKMLNSGKIDQYMDSAQLLSLRLLRKPVKIELCGLLDMRLVIIRKIVGMVTIYVTIMLQSWQVTGQTMINV